MRAHTRVSATQHPGLASALPDEQRTCSQHLKSCATRTACLQTCLFQSRREPVEERFVPELRVLGLVDPVSFVGKDQELRRHTVALERGVELERLRVRN